MNRQTIGTKGTMVRGLVAAVTAIFLTSVACNKTIPPPPVDKPESLPEAQIRVHSNKLQISSTAIESPAVIRVQPRVFDTWREFEEFAEETLGATVYRDETGKVRALEGEYLQSGQIVFLDSSGTPFESDEFIPAYLGGASGVLRIGEETFDLQGIDDDSSVVLLAKSEPNCIGNDCIQGESWLTHRIIYHSVGSRTRQTSGGTRTVAYDCCSSGKLVTVGGQRQCRGLRPGAWEYDRELRRLVPTGPDPYVFTEPRRCSRSTLNNTLTVEARLLFGPDAPRVLEASARNTKEVQVKRWLVTLGIDAGTSFVDDVTGVCGFHSSTRGGSVSTSDGFTGDEGLLCRGN